MHKFTNDLIKESSPYLRQHAHNPVNWVAWSDEAFAQAKREDKMVLVSIGYSACHWCHVMEHECFEDEEVATWMNRYFVCIKVDREERPDVDQVYMTAVQLMTQKGGWPLNCFTLADGKPIYGGTYFPKEQWLQVLKSLEFTYRNKHSEVLEYADRLQQGVQQSEWVQVPEAIQPFAKEKLDELVLRWSQQFDRREGGSNRAPKFPLPNNYEFLLRYGVWTQNETVLKQVWLTLDKMAYGGIYDQIGGGFCRYSVDVLWKVPHFEKMLYDNAQLVSLYAKAFQYSNNPDYKRVIEQTLDWLEREMTLDEGAFYSALDADSEGVEGKFYVWTLSELKNCLGDDFAFASTYYNLNSFGHWEEGNYILLRRETDASLAGELALSQEEFQATVKRINDTLLAERKNRIRPGLDHKCLTSWNAMMLKALVDASFALGDETLLHKALKNARWLVKCQITERKLLRNYTDGTSNIPGFLEDYCHVIAAFIRLYEATFDEDWLQKARELCDTAIREFRDEKGGMFYFTDSNSKLIARKMELNDNVIPGSNSVMCMNLFQLGTYFQHEPYIEMCKQQLANVYEGMESYGSGYSNWALVLMNFLQPFNEICLTGAKAAENRHQLAQQYLPNAQFSGGSKGTLPIFAGKDLEKNELFVCSDKTCSLPVSGVEELLKQIKS